MAAEVEIVVKATDSFSGVLGNFGNIMTGINSVINLASQAFETFAGFASEGLDAIASYERLGLALETLAASQALISGEAENMAQALQMTAGESEELLGWMQELAIHSPFTLEGVATAFRLAEAYGFNAEEAQRMTQALIDFAAGTGASEDAMGRIALALGQIEAKGRLSGQEVLQLVNAGLPVTQILANAFGVTTAEIERMREDGLIPAQDAIEAITEYLETNFAGAADRQSQSWAGLQGTFEDLKQMGLREFFGGLFDVLQPLAVSLSEFLQTEGLDRLSEMGQRLGEFTQSLVNFASTPLDFSDLTQSFENWVDGVNWDEVSNDLAEGISNIDWNAVGLEVRTGFIHIFNGLGTIISEVDWNALSISIGQGVQDMLVGAFGYADVESLSIDFWEGVEYALVSGFGYMTFEDLARDFRNGFVYIGNQAKLGLAQAFGYDDFLEFATDLREGFQVVIDSVKHFLGISSPSTVFASIGRDIVLGLISGFNNTWDNLMDIAGNALADFAALFGIDLDGILGTSSGTGTLGGGSGGSDSTVTGTSGGGGTGSVINNYYGPVYFQGGTEPGSYYDCPSPNPLVASSGNQLVTTGF